MTVTAINYLNILLMLVSVVLAYFFPVELFLFSYAILGPLHYTTEIGWLHKRQYFTNSNKDYYLLAAIALVVIGLMLTELVYIQVAGDGAINSMLIPYLRIWVSNLIVMAFIAALGMVLFKDNSIKLIFTFIVTGAILLIHSLQPYLVVLALLLPTMLHITLFMVAFIMYGALKGKSMSGYLSVLVFIACCLAFFIYSPDLGRQTSDYVMNRYSSWSFANVNRVFVGNLSLQDTLFSPTGLQVQRLIAFAYTYHYLNWFSKTKVIDWNNVTPAWRWFSVVTWVVLVALYLIDFKTGIIAAFFLGLLHVFFEFPLNYRTFIYIGQTTYSNIKSALVG